MEGENGCEKNVKWGLVKYENCGFYEKYSNDTLDRFMDIMLNAKLSPKEKYKKTHE